MRMPAMWTSAFNRNDDIKFNQRIWNNFFLNATIPLLLSFPASSRGESNHPRAIGYLREAGQRSFIIVHCEPGTAWAWPNILVARWVSVCCVRAFVHVANIEFSYRFVIFAGSLAGARKKSIKSGEAKGPRRLPRDKCLNLPIPVFSFPTLCPPEWAHRIKTCIFPLVPRANTIYLCAGNVRDKNLQTNN